VITDRSGWPIKVWCALVGIGKTNLYARWKMGTGPSSVYIGRRHIVTESPGAWLRRLGEAPSCDLTDLTGSSLVAVHGAPPTRLPVQHNFGGCFLRWTDSAFRTWQGLAPDTGIAILTVSRRGADEGTILSVTDPARQGLRRSGTKP
jgi:predicted DNA-binding transcriptional regulator AlpA